MKQYAILTNLRDWSPGRLLQWHRQKAVTIEAVHDVRKNELAAGVLPCGRFGATAAWLRLAVLTHNVLTALKRLALPTELLPVRPQRLRFLTLHTAGRLVHHARKVVLRLAAAAERLAVWREVCGCCPCPPEPASESPDSFRPSPKLSSRGIPKPYRFRFAPGQDPPRESGSRSHELRLLFPTRFSPAPLPVSSPYRRIRVRPVAAK